MDDPELWRWIWLVAGAGFAIGELAVAGTFFLLPFALGAAVACVLAFADLPLALQWIAFIGVSIGGFLTMLPLRKRLDRDEPQDGVGARRLLGQLATVLETLPGGPSETGLVRVGREEWRAESLDGRPIEAGSVVKVVEVRGTRVVVFPQAELPKES
jgi:membrane protein implicated in regulation of membrane protease activity